MLSSNSRTCYLKSILALLTFALAVSGLQAQVPASQREALVALFNSAGGSLWLQRSNWLGDPGTECQWFGVQCNDSNDAVVGLTLPFNRLIGELPDQLSQLTQLQTLNLEGSVITSGIPSSLGQLADLVSLNLNGTRVSGMIPAQLGQLSNLQELLLSGNQLVGAIPSELGGLSMLQALDLHRNRLSGPIPPELGQLSQLASLSLFGNDLSGPIPDELGDLSSLTELSMANNDLSGPLPSELGDLSQLRTLSLESNVLSGQLPGQIGQLSQLRSLQLALNDFSGGVPSELGALTNLDALDLAFCDLIGEIPTEIGQLASLRVLDLSANSLEGSLPQEMGDLGALELLNLSSNQLVGEVPEDFRDLNALISLNLRFNGLSAQGATAAFLETKQVDWQQTQTVPPGNFRVREPTPRSLRLRWSPIEFVGEQGGYRLFMSTTPGGPYQLVQTTADKTESGFTVRDLQPGTDYFFVAETVTQPHTANRNRIVSLPTPEVSASTEPDAGPPTRLLIPYFQGAENAFTGFAVSNFSQVNVRLDYTAFAADGAPADLPVNPSQVFLAAGTQTADLGSDLFEVDPDAPTLGWVELRADHPQIASFFQFGTGNLTQLDGSVAFAETSQKLYFPRIFEGPTAFRGQPAVTSLSIVNPGDAPIQVRMSLQAQGQEAQEEVRTIPARGFLFESVSQIFGDATEVAQGYVEVEVTQGEGAIGFELIQLEAEETVIGLNAGFSNPETRAFSAQLADIPGALFTSLNLINSSGQARMVDLTPIAEDGSQLAPSVQVQLDAGEQFSRDAGSIFDVGSDFAGSLEVEADGEGVVGDVIFGDSANFRFAAALPLQSRTFTDAVFSQVADIRDVFFTGLAFYNPNSEDAEVLIEVIDPQFGLAVGRRTLSLGAGRRLSELVSTLVPQAVGVSGGYVRVSSDQPLIAQLLFGGLDALGVSLFSAVPPTVID